MFPSPYITYLTHSLLLVSLMILWLVSRKHLTRLFNLKKGANLVQKNDLIYMGMAGGGAVGLVLKLIGLPFFVAAIAGVIAVFAIPVILMKRRQERYNEAFDRALAESLGTVSSSLRAGLTLKDALAVGVESCPAIFANEVELALKQYHFGTPIEKALDGVRERVPTQNCRIAFGAMIISSQLGGNLPAMLVRIIATIRERERVSGKLKALTAQGRSQAFLLCAAPPVLGIGMYFYDPQKMSLLTDYWVGQILLVLAIILEVVGIAVTSRVMKLEV